MPFDFAPDLPNEKQLQGLSNYSDGLAAEDAVRRDYLARGYDFVAERWRGRCGEIDLIFRLGDELVFVEVKKAKTLDAAATRLSERQLWRIARSAEDYVGSGHVDPFTPFRLDLAMVNQTGTVSVLENLYLH